MNIKKKLRFIFGVDLGGTTVKIGLFATGGEFITKWEIETDTFDAGAHILSDIANSIQDCVRKAQIDPGDIVGIGMGIPGPVRPDGTCPGCANLGWGETDVKGELKCLTGFKTLVANDANVAAMGEYIKYHSDIKNLALVTIGTGVGAGFVLKGRPLYGSVGAAAEIGHMVVNPGETAACACGGKGHLEQYASATGLVRTANRLMAEGDLETVLKAGFSAKDVFDAAREGDELSVAAVDQLGKYLGIALANIAVTINPEKIVLGGGISNAGDILTDVVSKHFKNFVFPACADTRIELARLGNDAGIYGGYALVSGKIKGTHKNHGKIQGTHKNH